MESGISFDRPPEPIFMIPLRQMTGTGLPFSEHYPAKSQTVGGESFITLVNISATSRPANWGQQPSQANKLPEARHFTHLYPLENTPWIPPINSSLVLLLTTAKSPSQKYSQKPSDQPDSYSEETLPRCNQSGRFPS